MSRYDDYPEHPLCGVPDDILDAARAVMAGVAEQGDCSAELADAIADSVVAALVGFLDDDVRRAMALRRSHLRHPASRPPVGNTGNIENVKNVVSLFGRREKTEKGDGE